MRPKRRVASRVGWHTLEVWLPPLHSSIIGFHLRLMLTSAR